MLPLRSDRFESLPYTGVVLPAVVDGDGAGDSGEDNEYPVD